MQVQRAGSFTRPPLSGPGRTFWEEADQPWRAVFTENGRRRFRQGATEAELAARLEKVTEPAEM
jgi:hypothetical protein